MIHLHGGSNLAVIGFYVENLHKYSPTPAHLQVSRAININAAINTHIRNSKIISGGKQALQFSFSEFAAASHLDISGSYFSLVTELTDLIIDNSKITQHFQYVGANVTIPVGRGANVPSRFEGLADLDLGDLGGPNSNDEHSLIWVDRSHFNARDLTVHTPTGRSLISGHNEVNQNIRITNITPLDNLDSWLQQHSNYRNLRLHLYGDYPTAGVQDFYVNTFGGGGSTNGSFVRRN